MVKTAAEKLEALFEKATGLLEDIEIDARLKHETGLGRSLSNMADRDIYTDEEISQLLSDYEIDTAELDGVRAGLRMAGLMVGNHDLDTDDDTDEDDAGDSAEARPEDGDVAGDVAEP